MLRFTIAILATLLACGIGVHAWRQRSFGIACLALWMATVAASGWTLVIMIGPRGILTPDGALLMGLALLAVGVLLARTKSFLDARRLLRASVVYLPLLLVLIIVDAGF